MVPMPSESNAAELLALHVLNIHLLDDTDWQCIMEHSDCVEEPRGQWLHPGRCTMIPSPHGRITMHNVHYPLLGIDETGHSIMMQPEQRYSYPGRRVYEIPVVSSQHKWLAQLCRAMLMEHGRHCCCDVGDDDYDAIVASTADLTTIARIITRIINETFGSDTHQCLACYKC